MGTLWVFDNDGTLYTNVIEIEHLVEDLMIKHIARELDLTFDYANELRSDLLKKHATSSTLIACMKEGFDPKEFVKETYLAVDLTKYVKPNRNLHDGLVSLPGQKVILTNNPSAYAFSVAKALGINEAFSGIYGMESMKYILKPDPASFIPVLSLGNNDWKRIFIDDSPTNIATAKNLGFETILVGNRPQIPGTADRVISLVEGLFV